MQLKGNILALLAVVMCLSGCLLIDDFGPYWKQAVIDKDLIGKWHDEKNNQKSIFIQQGDHLAYMNEKTGNPDDDTQIKTLRIATYRFLLMQNSTSKALFYYTLEDDVFKLYAPKKERREAFAEYSQNNPNIALNDKGIRVAVLNQEVIAKIVSTIEDGTWAAVATLNFTCTSNDEFIFFR